MKVLVAGDFCPRYRVQEAFDRNDYSVLDAMRAIILEADYSIVNLECPVVVGEAAQPIKKCGPCLKTTPAAIEAIQYAGFDCVTLANNHFRDYGDEGCITTIDLLQKANVDYVGGGRNLKDAQRVLYKDLSGKKLAIVNICENEFSIATDKQAGAAPLDTVDNYNQITEARKNADFVLVIVHGGHEHYQLPSPRMKKLYQHFITLGADAVVNHHQHCFSGYEYVDAKPIVYGLGNFCFDGDKLRQSSWNEGYCVEIDFDTFRIKLLPYKQCDNKLSVRSMKEIEVSEFLTRIYELNAIISDDELLRVQFEGWCHAQSREKMITFAPYGNRYLDGAAYRGWMPMRLNFKMMVRMLNHIACEAHRDITINVMNSKLQ